MTTDKATAPDAAHLISHALVLALLTNSRASRVDEGLVLSWVCLPPDFKNQDHRNTQVKGGLGNQLISNSFLKRKKTEAQI